MTELKIANLGAKWFYDSILQQGISNVTHIPWSPQNKSKKVYELLDILSSSFKLQEKITKANNLAISKLNSGRPFIIGIAPAIKVIPGMKKNLILHSGPPIEYDRMCGPMKGAIIGALVYEGIAKDVEEAEKIIISRKIKFSPCHHHNAVGPMAGIISASMPVWVVKNLEHNTYAFATINEGLGKVLRFGANSEDVIKRLKWIEKVLYPVLKQVIKLILKKSDGIDINVITSQALSMGDECHNRNIAASSLFLKEILPYLIEINISKKIFLEVVNFISSNPHFYLNISMAGCKSVSDVIEGIEYSSIVYTMARNGVEIGIRVAGLPKEWFTSPAGMPKGLFFPGFSQEDANPDLGDSTVSEVCGIGAFAMSCAPAIVKFVGGTPQDGINYTLEMYKITHGEQKNFFIPQFNFRGTPLGIDIIKVVSTGITPVINTGIAHKNPGIGQIGAGILSAPRECFIKSFERFMEVYASKDSSCR